MGWIPFNPNPDANRVGDCTIRAISLSTDQDWDSTYWDIALEGYIMKDMPSSNAVWSSVLMSKGFKRYILQDECPNCYTVNKFCLHLILLFLARTAMYTIRMELARQFSGEYLRDVASSYRLSM